jgi:4-amino-4-deoxy-L-arabinose transferase-like glycosyltransferase
MEQQSPGFLQYFIVGEHLLRFIQPGWQGDLYGNAHAEAPGMIWLLWFQATAAWGLLLALIAGRHVIDCWRNRKWRTPALTNWQRYLLCWMLAPMVFFSLSGNILWTYVISGLPAFALLLAGEQP